MKSRSVIVTLRDAHSVPSLRQYSVCGSLDELGTIPREHVPSPSMSALPRF
jgi:hypothetical protein